MNMAKELRNMSLAKGRCIQTSISTSLVLLLLHHPKLYLYNWERAIKAFCRMPSPNARKMLCMNREILKPVPEVVERLFVGSLYVDGRELTPWTRSSPSFLFGLPSPCASEPHPP
jgi:hypothetical protein